MKRKLSLAGFVQQRKPYVKTLSAAKKKRGKSPLEHVPEKLIDFSGTCSNTLIVSVFFSIG